MQAFDLLARQFELFEALPPLLSVPALLVGPASLLFAAAVDGGLHQFRLVTQRSIAS